MKIIMKFLNSILDFFKKKQKSIKQEHVKEEKQESEETSNAKVDSLETNKENNVTNNKLKETKIMKLEVLRFSSQKDSTLGALFDVTNGREFLCYTIEDEYRTEKQYGETRIPVGEYKIILRTEGSFHERYNQKFPDMHKGMLWLQDVPKFKYVLIHIGNKDDDTAGCLLVGDSSIQNITEEGMIGSSTSAYKRIYPLILSSIEQDKDIFIKYVNYDNKIKI